MEPKLVYTGKTKNVYALDNGNYLLNSRTTAPARTACSIPAKTASASPSRAWAT